MRKLLLGVVGGVAALALLVVLAHSARARGRRAHCRNNLRHLGEIAYRNWQLVDPELKGRAFWQAVREVTYKKVRGGGWKPMEGNPFVCPVLGTTVPDPERAEAIDYRGPKSVPDDAAALKADRPLGADREGNHGSGGNVLFVDGSVRDAPARVDEVSGGSSAWSLAAEHLTD